MNRVILVATTLVVIFFTSCNKEMNSLEWVDVRDDNNLKLTAQSYFLSAEKSKKLVSSDSKNVKSNRLKLSNSPKWENSKIYFINQMRYLLVPLEYRSELRKEEKITIYRNLIFFEDVHHQMKAYIMEVVGDNTPIYKRNIDKIIVSAIENEFLFKLDNHVDFHAFAIFYDLNRVWKSSLQAKDGKWKRFKFQTQIKYVSSDLTTSSVSKNSLVSPTSPRICEAYNEYLIIYDLETGDILEWIFLYTFEVCAGEDGDSTGGGGGDGEELPDSNENCSENLLLNAISGFKEKSDLVNVKTTIGNANKRDKYYDWVFLSNGIMKFISRDHAVQVQGADLKWRFESLTHDGDSQDGAMIGIIVTYKITQNIPTISTAKLNASMVLKPTLKFELVCKGSPIYRHVNYECIKYFNVND